jgi:hypothetical protein
MTILRALHQLIIEILLSIWDFLFGEESGDYIQRGILFGYANVLCALLYEPGSGWFVCFMAMGCYWALNILEGWDRYLEMQLDRHRTHAMIQSILFSYTPIPITRKGK